MVAAPESLFYLHSSHEDEKGSQNVWPFYQDYFRIKKAFKTWSFKTTVIKHFAIAIEASLRSLNTIAKPPAGLFHHAFLE